MQISFQSTDLKTLINQPQKFNQGPVTEKTPESKPDEFNKEGKNSNKAGKGFFWGAATAIVATILIAGKGSPKTGWDAISGGLAKTTDEINGELEKLNRHNSKLKAKVIELIKGKNTQTEKLNRHNTKLKAKVKELINGKNLVVKKAEMTPVQTLPKQKPIMEVIAGKNNLLLPYSAPKEKSTLEAWNLLHGKKPQLNNELPNLKTTEQKPITEVRKPIMDVIYGEDGILPDGFPIT